MRLRLFLSLLILCLLGGNALASSGQLSGYADWRYGYYHAEVGGQKYREASYFTQQYSLLYQREGVIAGGRGGNYKFGLGGEWNSLDGKIDGQSDSVNTFKLFYRGDILFAPGGLPLRIHAYSHDLAPSQFVEDSRVPEDGILVPHVVDNLLDGQHLRSGVTMEIGVRNGGYLGRYQDIFGDLPRLLVDYREDRVRDTKSNTPSHYRLRNLAFVSLNKMDNWFHYRYTDYTDYINPNENYVEKTFILGTIDQSMRRHWIDLTNWIKVSADGTFTKTTRVTLDQGPEKIFTLNLFGTANRTAWQGSSFSNFQRIDHSGLLEKRLEVPILLNGELNRETSWRFRFSGYEDAQTNLAPNMPTTETDENDAFASTQVKLFRQQRFIVAPQLELESKTGDRGEGQAAKASIEAYTNHDYRPAYDLLGSYSIAYFTGNGINVTHGVSYLEQQLKGQVGTNLSMRTRVGLTEELLYGDGTLDRTVADNIVPRGDLTLDPTSSSQVTRKGQVFRSTTSTFLENRYAPWHLSNRVEAVNDYLSASGEAEDQVTLRHYLRFDRRNFNASMRSELIIGGKQSFGGFGSSTLQAGSTGAASKSFDNTTTLWYSPGPSSEGSLAAEYRWRSGGGASSNYWNVKQKYNYGFFSTLGFVRKIAELRQELEYERFQDVTDKTLSLATVTLGGDYYPTSISYIGAKVRYRHYDPQGVDEMAYYLTAGLDFQKLKVDLDYAYGDNSADATGNSRNEQRAEVHVKKIF